MSRASYAVQDVKKQLRERLHRMNYGPPAAEPVVIEIPVDVELAKYSTQQKLALLQMSSRISHQAIWREMRTKFEAPPFTLSTFRQLADLGVAEKLEGQKYHSLNLEGSRLCDLIGRALVKEHNIHTPWIGGNDGAYTSVHCTCLWSASIRRGVHTQANAMRAFGTHFNTVNAVAELGKALVPRSGGGG